MIFLVVSGGGGVGCKVVGFVFFVKVNFVIEC